jgi:alkaline phosphatase
MTMPKAGRQFIQYLIAIAVIISLSCEVQAAEEPLTDTSLQVNAQNIILLIGDGMGEGQRTAARWYSAGLDGQLAMNGLSTQGSANTASADSPITDSAASATAMATGIKTNNGVIGIIEFWRQSWSEQK